MFCDDTVNGHAQPLTAWPGAGSGREEGEKLQGRYPRHTLAVLGTVSFYGKAMFMVSLPVWRLALDGRKSINPEKE